MKLAPPAIPNSLKGGSRIVARVETVAKGANVDAVATDWGSPSSADARLT